MNAPRVTPNEAAKWLGVSAKQVWTWCESGALPGYRSVNGWRKIDRPVYARHGLTVDACHSFQRRRQECLRHLPENPRMKFEDLYDIEHPLSAALEKLATLEAIRIIEGKAGAVHWSPNYHDHQSHHPILQTL